MIKENGFEDIESLEKKQEEIERDPLSEDLIETGPDAKELETDTEKVKEIREKLKKIREKKETKELPSDKEIERYQEENIPSYLQEPQEGGTTITRSLGFLLEHLGRFEIDAEERENLPEQGPFLVVCNHFGGETPVLFSLLRDHDNHIAAGEELNWKRSRFRPWILRMMRMISVEESLVHLSDDEKEELLKRVPGRARKEGYSKVIEKERQGRSPINIKFIREAAALLARGDVVTIFPEGLFLYEDKPGLHQGQRGLELLAREYKRLTGKELPIVPVAIFEEGEDGGKKTKKVRVGGSLLLSENDTDLSDTDWCMSHLAELLSEDQRGDYSETA